MSATASRDSFHRDASLAIYKITGQFSDRTRKNIGALAEWFDANSELQAQVRLVEDSQLVQELAVRAFSNQLHNWIRLPDGAFNGCAIGLAVGLFVKSDIKMVLMSALIGLVMGAFLGAMTLLTLAADRNRNRDVLGLPRESYAVI